MKRGTTERIDLLNQKELEYLEKRKLQVLGNIGKRRHQTSKDEGKNNKRVAIGPAVRIFANGLGDRSLIPG